MINFMGHVDFYSLLMVIVFVVGYIFITIEHITHINKTTVALLMAIACWVIQFANQSWLPQENINFLGQHVGNISQVVFFILGALTVVEIISEHKGFRIISDAVCISSKRKLLWVVGLLTFFLSAVLDNLTTTIVMISFLRKVLEEREDRLLFGGAVVIAANAGGAWTPIGDVTTTMLWIGGQVSTLSIMKSLLVPSLACFFAAFAMIHFRLQGNVPPKNVDQNASRLEPLGMFILFMGIGLLMFVPVFKILTGLPPFMGILLALGVLWLVTDIVHSQYEERHHLRVPHVLTKIDMSSALFFLGILLCVNALESAKILEHLAAWLDKTVGNTTVIATAIGLASAVIDNVPLVAASMGMYSLHQYPTDSMLWELIAFCAGTGGSILIVGSAAGVVFMGLEKVNFMWYLKNISLPALVGYFVGLGVYLVWM